MNIGVDIKALGKGRGGIANYILSVLRALARTDSENRYFLFEKVPVSGVPDTGNFTKIPLPSFLPGTLWLQMVVPLHLRRHGIDVLWCPEQIAPAVHFPAQIKRVVTVHDMTYMHFPSTMQTSNFWVFALLSARSLRLADHIIAVSEFSRADLLHCYPTLRLAPRTSVIHHGCPEWKIPDTYEPARRGRHLLFVGTCEPRKNLLQVLTALVLLRNRGLTVDLKIVGPSGWKSGPVHAFIRDNRLEGQVGFSGFMNADGLIGEYLRCRALIFPSRLEGFGLPVLEALATDTLVLTSRGTVMEEIGGDAVMLFDAGDAADIARAIERVYSSGFNRDAYLDTAPDICRRYSWEESARRHREVFHRAAGNS